jgi:6-phosphogluconolactonase (cycloisomerase 2 family)
MYRLRICLTLLIVCLFCETSFCQEIRHEHVQTVEDESLSNVVAVQGTPDGKFVYTCGFDPGTLVCFSRNQETGELTKVHQYDEDGLVDLVVSPDGKYLITNSFMSHSVILYRRDLETGELEKTSTISQQEYELMNTPVSVRFSPDGKFAYTSASGTGRLLVLEIDDEANMKVIQEHAGEEDCLAGGRVISMDSAGKFIYIASHTAGTITMFERDPETGKVELFKHIMDDSIYGALLAGAHGTVLSADGKSLYLVSGRFNGDDAITAFRVKEDGNIKMIQEFENGVELEGFTGGNHIAVSPDGAFVYASGATSGNLAVFKRSTETGKLEFVNYLEVEGSSQLEMTAGIHVSSDNQFVYVGGEGSSKVFVFKRAQ